MSPLRPEPMRDRENADPHEQDNPVPRLVVGLVVALLAWVVAYIVIQDGNAPAELGDRRNPAALFGARPDDTLDGARLYANTCQSCHQANGQGLQGVFPPLAGSPWVTGDAEVGAQIVLHGLTGSIDVLGTTYDGAMPGLGSQLNDAEIAAVLSYIRSQWGNEAAPVDAAAIQASRQASAGRTEPWSGAAELADFGKDAARDPSGGAP